MLSRNAFNALLKTLEEPPPHVKFVFATTELRKVPVTVLSRCQRFDLRRVRIAELAAHFGRIAGAGGGGGGAGRARPDRAGGRWLGARRAVAARPGDRAGGWPRHRGGGRQHAGAGGPRPGVRPHGGGDGRPAAPGAADHRAGARARRRSRHDAAGPAGADLHGHPPEVGAGAARQPGTAGGRAHPWRGAGGSAVGAGAGARLADAAEGRRRGGDRAGPSRRRRDGADPALPCVRPALAGQSGSAAEQQRHAGVRPARIRRHHPVAARGRSPAGHPSRRPTPRRAWRASAMSPPWWPRSARRCCTRT